jgi:hypothetical protein
VTAYEPPSHPVQPSPGRNRQQQGAVVSGWDDLAASPEKLGVRGRACTQSKQGRQGEGEKADAVLREAAAHSSVL